VCSSDLCAAHQAPAVAVCHRCGVFLCALCSVPVDANVFCAACAARPEVDYVEAYRLNHWGRRDGWAWAFGLGGVLNLIIAVPVLATAFKRSSFAPQVALGLGMLLAAGSGFAWFFRQVWARWAVVVLFVLFAAEVAFTAGVSVVPALIFPTAILISAFNSVRSQLFFKLDVPRERIRRDWQLYHDNPAARSAVLLGVSGLLVPGFGLLAIGFALWAFKRVNPVAHPPVGGRRNAVIGLVLGVIDTLLWGAVILRPWLR
jgi:hypothetical protein